MKLSKSLGLFAENAAWRATGLRPAGRALVRALNSTDENARTIAGMFLTQAGERAEPLLLEALDKRETPALVLTILGSIGDRKVEPEIRRYVNDPDPDVAKAARDALRMLEAGQSLA